MIRSIELTPTPEKIEKVTQALAQLQQDKPNIDPQEYDMEEVCLTDLLQQMKAGMEEVGQVNVKKVILIL